MCNSWSWVIISSSQQSSGLHIHRDLTGWGWDFINSFGWQSWSIIYSTSSERSLENSRRVGAMARHGTHTRSTKNNSIIYTFLTFSNGKWVPKILIWYPPSANPIEYGLGRICHFISGGIILVHILYAALLAEWPLAGISVTAESLAMPRPLVPFCFKAS